MNLKEKARIVEAAEAAYLAASFSAAPPEIAKELGMKVFQMWGGVASLMLNDPTNGFWSRIVGIGIDRSISIDFLEAIDSLYIANGYANTGGHKITLQISPIAKPEDYEGVLEFNGYKRGHTWVKLLRELHDIPDADTDLHIRELDREDVPEYGRVYWEGFGLAFPPFTDWMNAHVGLSDWKMYGAFDGPKLVAVSAMYARGDVACLSGSTTLPFYRKRGAQSAMMVARLKAAAEMDLSWASTETGSETIDRPNSSLHNMNRMGFEVLYERYNWLKKF
jgi:hypothetical protein